MIGIIDVWNYILNYDYDWNYRCLELYTQL